MPIHQRANGIQAGDRGQRVPVVILNWNGEANTIECLRSIRESDQAGFVPVLVDNGSIPASVERLKRACGQIFGTILYLKESELLANNGDHRADFAESLAEDSLVFIENAENRGFAGGCNIGIRFAELVGAEWVMLLNNDTVVAPGAFRELRTFLGNHPSFVAITAQIRDYGSRTRIQNCGGRLTYFGSRRYRFAGMDASVLPQSPFSIVTFVSGCALLLKHTVTGVLTEEFFYGEEDYEFSLRMRALGLAMACAHGAVVYHKGGASLDGIARPVGSILSQFVNRLVNTRNHYSKARWQATRILAYLYLPVLLARRGIDPRKARALIRRTQAHLRDHRGVGREAFESMIMETGDDSPPPRDSVSATPGDPTAPGHRRVVAGPSRLRGPRALYRAVFRRDRYNVGLVHAPIHRFLDSGWRPEIHWLPRRSRSGAFIADPFGMEVGGKQYLLCEYFDYGEPRGRIMGGEVRDSVLLGDLEDVIVGPCHMSYPFLVVHEGQAFCIPETSRANEVALYRMGASPAEWTKEAVLLNVAAVDPSVVHYGGRWWLFYVVRGTNAELFIAYADSLFGPWLPHARRPAKTDVASARPAGTPFVHMGRLYRPAQDCSRVYGGRVVINEVLALSPDHFEERVVAVVEPDGNGPYPHGLHTLSAFGDMTLVDGKREQFIWRALVRSVRDALRRRSLPKEYSL